MSICRPLTIILLLFTVGCFADTQPTAESKADLVTLSINQIVLHVELADDVDERARGLMYRQSLCDDCGMLFKFDSIRYASMWMKNTYIPLDVAYINAFGKITDIKPMQPEDLTSIRSSVPVLYALEMNQGWFAKQGIKVGDMIRIPTEI